MRIIGTTIVAIGIIISIGCYSKSDQPHSSWPYLRSGMPSDSAKLLITQAGWVRDTRFDTVKMDTEFGMSMMWFKDIHVSGIQKEFSAIAMFSNNRFMNFHMNEEPSLMLPFRNCPPAHNKKDYEELVSAMTHLYGQLNHRDSTINKYFDMKDNLVRDTTYMSSWIDSTNGRKQFNSVMLQMPDGRLSFSVL